MRQSCASPGDAQTWPLDAGKSELAVVLVVAEAVLFAAALLAALGPLRQAAKADPLEILRAT